MARQFFFTLLLVVLLVDSSVSISPPGGSPGPAPETLGGAPVPQPSGPRPVAPASAPSIPGPHPEPHSPPAPPPSVDGPSPSPSPSDVSDISHDSTGTGGDQQKGSSGGSKGKKIGIAFGVIIGAAAIALGGFVYKKRQDNIRRSQYGSAVRREFL